MLIGDSIHANSGETKTYYSPWFPRGGNGGNFSCQVIAQGHLASFEITVQTKNSEQPDASAHSYTAQVIAMNDYQVTTWFRGDDTNASGVNPGSTAQGMLELVRFKYVVVGDLDAGYAHFRMMVPAWLRNGA